MSAELEPREILQAMTDELAAALGPLDGDVEVTDVTARYLGEGGVTVEVKIGREP